MPPAGSRLINSLKDNESFYLGVDGDHFNLRDNVILLKPANQYIEEGQLAAVSLTEQCRKYRIGKVLGCPSIPMSYADQTLTSSPIYQRDPS